MAAGANGCWSSAGGPLDLVEAAVARLADRFNAAVSLAEVGAAPRAEQDDWPEIRSTLQGDGDAYARLVRKYQETIAAQMWRFCRQQNDCEELTHEVFVEAYVSLRRYRGDAPLVHWLRKIATRVGYRYYKRQVARRSAGSISLQDWDQSEATEQSKSNTEIVEAAEAAANVHSLLAQLPPRDRLVLTLIYLEECTVAQAAELIGWSQTMVKVQAHRARKKLKKLCESQGSVSHE